ncbi:MAG: hypothetical protein QM760_00895 [Nibricoccus sp.]
MFAGGEAGNFHLEFAACDGVDGTGTDAVTREFACAVLNADLEPVGDDAGAAAGDGGGRGGEGDGDGFTGGGGEILSDRSGAGRGGAGIAERLDGAPHRVTGLGVNGLIAGDVVDVDFEFAGASECGAREETCAQNET